MKKIILLFFLNSILWGQIGYVDINNPVYEYLARMDACNIIEDYDQFELPKTRKEITMHIKTIMRKRNLLNSIDRERLNDLFIEFEYDLYGTTKNQFSLFTDSNTSDIFSEKEKHLYYYTDTNKVDLFVNFIGESTFLFNNDYETKTKSNSTVIKFGGLIRGSVLNHFGFSIMGTNGSYFGDRDLAFTYSGLGYNYKINVPQDGIGDDYFDDTRGFLTADFDYVKVKIGRDKLKIGYGAMSYLMGSDFPPTDYISLNLNYKALSFSYYHMKLLGEQSVIKDPIQGDIRQVDDKYWVYHRLGINFTKHFTFGVGEVVLYANRNVDFSYLNPFNFYKSVEHANQDRDNSMMFFDFTNNSIDGLKFFGTFLMDDADFGKLGTDWYGNKFLLNLGAYSAQLNHLVPINFEVQYIRIDPYVYTHRINNNNYSTLGNPLISELEPNSENFLISAKYHPHHDVDMSFSFYYSVHGANEIDNEGAVITNYGGDILVGHRQEDSDSVVFLNGERETQRVYTFKTRYEFINNYKLVFDLQYTNSQLQTIGKYDNLRGILSLFVDL